MRNNLYLSQNVQDRNTMPSKSLLEYTHFGYMWKTVSTKRIVASHTVYSMLEEQPFADFLTEEKWQNFVHPQDLYKLIQAEEKLIVTGKQVSIDYRLITKNGKHIFINHFMQLSVSHDNEVKILSILDDITEQKSAEVILEVMNEGFFELDKNFVFRRINAKAELFWQVEMERKELIGKCIWEVFPEAVNTPFYELIINAQEDKQNIIQDVIFPVNNCWIHVSISPYIDGLIIIFHDIQHEKEAAQHLKESKELLEASVNTSAIGMASLKTIRDANNNIVDFEYIWLNKVSADLAGENVTGKRMLALYPHTKEIGLFDEYVKAAEHNTTIRFEEYYQPKDKWYNWNANKLNEGLFITVEDITDRKKAEHERKESMNVVEALFDTSLIGMSVLKAIRNEDGKVDDFTIQLVNKKLEALTGRNDLVGQFYAREYPGIKKTDLFKTMLEVMESGEPLEMEYYYPYEGFNKWFSSMFVKMGDGLIATNLDITERKLAEEEKLKNLTLLQQSEELAKAGSWDYDVTTHAFLWSDGMYGLFGIKKGTRLTPSVYLDYAIDDDWHIAEKVVDGIEQNFSHFEETLRIYVNGAIKIVKIKAAPFRNAEGQIEKMLGVDIDITSAIGSEEKINELNKTLTVKNRELQSVNSELKTFNSIAANDYQETLRHLYTNLEFIVSKDARNLSDTGKANVRRAQTAVQKLKLLTDDIVTFSKIQSLSIETAKADLNDILKNVLLDMNSKISEAEADITLDKLPVIESFPLLLPLLFNHLIDNALKFRDEYTKPVISIKYEKINNVKFKPDDDGSVFYHVIKITDNGLGFDQAESEKIFNIFYRLHERNKFKGSGIGLAVCKKIMDLHDGFIKANGIKNEGAEFSCYFPV